MNSSRSDINNAHPLMRCLPIGWRPFASLIRLDRPIGTYLAFLPALMGLHLAIDGNNLDLLGYIRLCAILLLGAFIMRGAGCICNDYIDRDIDPMVTRTATRPLASGQLRPNQALIFLFALACIALGLLLLLPVHSWFAALFVVPMVIFYPLLKRFFIAPQLGLGLVFTTGVWFGWLCLQPWLPWDWPLLLYLACIFWTIGFDTVYALQDREDDRALGIYSLAITAGRYVWGTIVACYAISMLLYAWVIVLSQDAALFPLGWRLCILVTAFIIFIFFTCWHYGVTVKKAALFGNILLLLSIFANNRKKGVKKKVFSPTFAAKQQYNLHAASFRSNAFLGFFIAVSLL